jgi:hypothetical protein
VAADNLIISVQEAISTICISPYRYRNTYKNLREVTLKKYPFNLIYSIDENQKLITIISLSITNEIQKINTKTKINFLLNLSNARRKIMNKTVLNFDI